MRKLKKGRKFGRKRDQRKAFLNSLTNNLILKERIKTTEARAKELSSFAEKIITKSKKGDLASRRKLSSHLSPESLKKLFNEIAPRYKERKGGYTRIFRLGERNSDGSKMVIIELIK